MEMKDWPREKVEAALSLAKRVVGIAASEVSMGKLEACSAHVGVHKAKMKFRMAEEVLDESEIRLTVVEKDEKRYVDELARRDGEVRK